MLMKRLMWIAWPAFLAAGLLVFMLFSVLDPLSLTLFGEQVEWRRETVYTVTFFIFWFIVMAAAAVTTWMATAPREVNRHQRKQMQKNL